MLEGLRVLGRAALEARQKRSTGPEEALLHALVKTDDVANYRGLVHLKLVSQGQGWTLEADVQDLDTEALHQALWLGHAPRNKAQNRVTVSRLEYLISQALPALTGRIDDGLEEGELRQILTRALDAISLELPGGQERYRWVWDLAALGWSRWEWVPRKARAELEAMADAGSDVPTAAVWQAYARKHGSKRTIPVMAAMLEAGLRARLGLERRADYLYTLHLDGRWLAREPAYHRLLYRYYLDELFAQARPGTCYVCGQSRERLTQDTSRFWLKLYITDKPGFASGFVEANFYRNYRLCPECYQVLLAGEAFLRTRLRSRLGTLPVYVVPVFHHPQVQPKGTNLEAWAEYITDRWQASVTLKGWQAFQEKLQRYRRYEERKAAFLLDFLFVEDDGRSVKLQYYIRDVPPSRLDDIDRARQQVRRLAETHLAPVNPWDLGLGVLFYLFPVGQRGQGRKAFFQFLESLLTQRPVPFRRLIPLFLETASIHRFQKYGAYVHAAPKDAELALRVFLVQSLLLRILLQRLDLLIPSGGVPMSQARFLEEIRRLVPAETWEYMQALGLNLAQSALFLLGVLVGEVAQKQQTTGSTPILNKIHFQGMDAHKVRRLSNEILEQMRIYKALNARTRDLFAAMRTLMDQAGNLLSPAENTYWVLSGYAFRHLQRFGQEGKAATSSDTAAE